MKKIGKHIAGAVLSFAIVAGTPQQANCGATILGIGGFDDAAFNSVMVGLLSSIEALNEIANSNTAKTLMHTAELADRMKAVVKKIDKLASKYQKGKIMLEMTAMCANIYTEFKELIRHIYDNEELLKIEEIEFFVHLLDYMVFDAVAEKIDKNGSLDVTKEAKSVAGGALEELIDVFKWMMEEQDENISATALNDRVRETYNKLARVSRDLQLMRRYTYGYLVAKRYRAGAYDNREYIRYVYYSKYRGMAVDKYK